MKVLRAEKRDQSPLRLKELGMERLKRGDCVRGGWLRGSEREEGEQRRAEEDRRLRGGGWRRRKRKVRKSKL